MRLGDVGHTWEVRCTDARRPRPQGRDPSRKPDVVIGTDADTWLRLREGELSGLDAFSQRARSTPAATSTSPSASRACSACPTAARRCCASTTSRSGRLRISTLTMGEGPDVLLIHGLGGDEGLVLRHRGRAEPHLPRPRARPARLRLLEQAARGAYDARWFAEPSST